jgi:hypothetical protein
MSAIHLEIRMDGDTPVGRACDEQGRSHEIAGWVSLIAVVDALLTQDPHTPDER